MFGRAKTRPDGPGDQSRLKQNAKRLHRRCVSVKQLNAACATQVAERTVSLLRGYHNSDGTANEAAPTLDEVKDINGPKAKLAALKHLLGKPHVYGVADRAFK